MSAFNAGLAKSPNDPDLVEGKEHLISAMQSQMQARLLGQSAEELRQKFRTSERLKQLL